MVFEGLNLAMGAAPLMGIVGRAGLQTARFGAQVLGSAARSTAPLVRGVPLAFQAMSREVVQTLRLPSLRFANAMAGEARVVGSEASVALRRLLNSDPKIIWVAERAAMGDRARFYNDSVIGARSNAFSKIGEAPSLSYIKDDTIRTVRFDGVEGSVLIDRKLAVVTTDKSMNQASRQSEALLQNGYTGRWEVPNILEADRAQRLFDQLGIKNITVRVVNE